MKISLPKYILYLSASLFLFSFSIIKAQFYNFPNEYASSLITEKILSGKDSSVHAGIKPYIHFFSEKYVNQPDTHRIFKYIINDPALDIAFFKHVLNIHPHAQNFTLTLDPVFNVNIGNDYYNDTLKTQTNTNSRGVIGAGYIGNNVYFETMFVENQSIFPQYIYYPVNSMKVVPGQGRWKNFKNTGFDYAFSSGFVSVHAFRNLNIQFGHGKQKIGNGYRSLLLSDNAFNYPYARFTHQWLKGRIQYSNIYAVLMNLDSASKKPTPNAEILFQKKPAAFQYVSVNAAKFLNLGFFQGMIWQAGDSRNMQQLNLQYFNPVIYSNIPEYGFNNEKNILAGVDLKIKITGKINVYGQVMADDLSNIKTLGNGTGYQAGINYYDVARIKNLFFQAEYNHVNEGSYQSPYTTRGINQSYSHYNQNLAFTQGYGEELFLMTDYKFKRFFVNARYHHQTVPKNGDHYYTTRITGVKLGYLLNPAYNLNLSLGYIYRNQNFPNFKNLSNQTNYIYLGLRTSIYNIYYDF